MKGPSRQRGLSLIETLVVVVILLVLATLLLPVVGRMAETARSVKCVSNLKNIGLLAGKCIAENNGYLPWYDAKAGVKGMWWNQIQTYAGLSDKEFSALFTCPSFKESPPPYQGRTFTYVYNKKLGYYEHNSNGSTWVYPRVNLLAVKYPARVPLVADSFKDPVLANGVNGTRGDGSAGFELWRMIYAAHGEKDYGNVLMLDGHIERVNRPREGEKHSNSKVPVSFPYEFTPSN